MIRKILVVCEGNICRSPMTSGLMKQALQKLPELRVVEVCTAGLNAVVGRPPDENAIVVMAKIGIDISSHRARSIDPALVTWADLIIVMEERQRRKVHLLYPESRGKVFCIGQSDDQDIVDPYGQSENHFYLLRDKLRHFVELWIQKLSSIDEIKKRLLQKK